VSPGIAGALRRAESAPASLSDAAYIELLRAAGSDLEELCGLADELRQHLVGDEITFVANRNLETAAVGGADPASLELLSSLVDEAWALGATEICMQGRVREGRGALGYLELVSAVTGQAPGLHLHAFRPPEILDGATRARLSLRDYLERAREAGLGSVPGTAARILDDEVRAVLNGGPDLPVAAWITVITIAHEVGLPSTATLVYGHVETPAQVVAHLRTLARIQDETGGFTEFIAMPYVPATAPVPGRTAGAGPTRRETRALHAVARLMLAGRIDHIQAAWTKLDARLRDDVLLGGADDLGGLLLDGRIAPSAGPEAGRELTTTEVEAIAREIGRTTRQRTTLYGQPSPERIAALRAAEGRAGDSVDPSSTRGLTALSARAQQIAGG